MSQKSVLIVLILFGLLSSWMLSAQSSATEVNVTLPVGEVRLKTLFASISKQTGYVFSYDANKINDNVLITIGKNNVFTLSACMDNILAPGLKYKIMDKYIVLYSRPNLNETNSEPLKGDKLIDLRNLKPMASEVVYLFPRIDFTDTVNVEGKGMVPGGLPGGVPGAVVAVDEPARWKWQVEATGNLSMAHLSATVGKKPLYVKATLGNDYHDSYHVGLGIGTNVNLTSALGLRLELVQHMLAFGKTRKMDINAYTTELTPLVTYALNERLTVLGGLSFNRIQSSLHTKKDDIDLGTRFGCNATIGVQFLLFKSK